MRNIGSADRYLQHRWAASDRLQCLFQKQNEAMLASLHEQNQKKENWLAGIVGAFIGSLIGVGVIILLGQLGYVAALSGIAMAVCALKRV